MLARVLAPGDRFGVIAFGGEAKWALQPTDIGAGQQVDTALNLPSHEPRTDFAAPLRTALEYISQQPQAVRDSYETSIVLLTDGAPDPEVGKYPGNAAQANRAESLQLSERLSAMGARVYTIGLGPAVEADFLSKIAATSHGLYAPARTAGDLQQAFLRVFTRVVGLPVYTESVGAPEIRLDPGAKASRALIFFFHENTNSTLASPGKKLVETPHITVYDEAHPGRELKLSVAGPQLGTSVVMAVDQPLRFEMKKPLPAAVLTNSDLTVSTSLMGGGEPVWNKVFMRDCVVQLHLSGPDGRSYTRPLAPTTQESFETLAQPFQTGDYDAFVELSSPYGAVSTEVGRLRVSSTAAAIPAQVEIEYPSVPAFINVSWLASTKITVPAVLPTGTARVVFALAPLLSVSQPEFVVDSVHPADVKVEIQDPSHFSGPTGIPYHTYWTDGEQKQDRSGVLIVVGRPTPLGEYLWKRKWKLFGGALGILLLVWIVRRILPRHPAMRGVLMITAPGAPPQRFEAFGKVVQVYESSSNETRKGDKLRIQAKQDRLLFSIRLVHHDGHWKPSLEGDFTRLSGKTLPSNRDAILVRDSGVKIEFHNFQQA